MRKEGFEGDGRIGVGRVDERIVPVDSEGRGVVHKPVLAHTGGGQPDENLGNRRDTHFMRRRHAVFSHGSPAVGECIGQVSALNDGDL